MPAKEHTTVTLTQAMEGPDGNVITHTYAATMDDGGANIDEVADLMEGVLRAAGFLPEHIEAVIHAR